MVEKMSNEELRDLTCRTIQALNKIMQTAEAGTIPHIARLTKEAFNQRWKSSTATTV